MTTWGDMGTLGDIEGMGTLGGTAWGHWVGEGGHIEGDNWGGGGDSARDIMGTIRTGWGALGGDIRGLGTLGGGGDSNGDITATPPSLQVTAAAGTPQVSIPLPPPRPPFR